MPATTIRRGGVTRDQREAPRWASRAARDLHLQPRTVEARVHSTTRPTIQEELATILRRLLETGNLPLVAKMMAPVEAALAGLAVPPLGDEVIAAAVRPDEEESIARDAYLMDPTPTHRRAWRVALERQRATSLPLYLALVAAEREGHC
jgi:hypothetical protein